MKTSNFGKTKRFLANYKRDERGVASIAWAVSLVAILGAIGAAVDFAIYANADARSQAIADTTALAAAVYVKTNGRPPTEKGELTEGKHTAASLGYEFKSFVDEGVEVFVNYDDDAKEVTTRVVGKTNPVLIQLLGYDKIDFEATSVVSYLNVEDTFPASIALVLDNSGSMQFDDKPAINIKPVTHEYSCVKRRRVWKQVRNRRGKLRWVQVWEEYESTCYYTHDPGERAPGAEIRLVGLKNSVVTFQTELKDRLGVEDDTGRRTLRMGMLPYSSAIIAAGEQPMAWGYLAEGDKSHVNNNANPSDDVAVSRGIYTMRADGGTNSSPPMSTAKRWLELETAVHTAEAERTSTEDKDPLKFVIFMTDGQNTVGNWSFTPGSTGRWYRRRSDGSYEGRNSYAQGFQEGSARLLTDDETVAACQAMHSQGVKIFTIGYALEEFGRFRVNGWGGRENDSLWNISSDTQTAAYSLMESCASEPENFIKAADARQLEKAFDEIQNAIVEELIRVKS